MICSFHRRNAGSVLVFTLLAFIALLALGVVMLSRSGRNGLEPPSQSPVSTETTAPINLVEESTSISEVIETPKAPLPAEAQLTPVNFPPPPPPVTTPDTRNLPPEG